MKTGANKAAEVLLYKRMLRLLKRLDGTAAVVAFNQLAHPNAHDANLAIGHIQESHHAKPIGQLRLGLAWPGQARRRLAPLVWPSQTGS